MNEISDKAITSEEETIPYADPARSKEEEPSFQAQTSSEKKQAAQVSRLSAILFACLFASVLAGALFSLFLPLRPLPDSLHGTLRNAGELSFLTSNDGWLLSFLAAESRILLLFFLCAASAFLAPPPAVFVGLCISFGTALGYALTTLFAQGTSLSPQPRLLYPALFVYLLGRICAALILMRTVTAAIAFSADGTAMRRTPFRRLTAYGFRILSLLGMLLLSCAARRILLHFLL